MSNIYITTTLPYVNADPHIGFALEVVQADAFARFHRALGNEVFFSTGTDEHGQKIAEKAAKEGRDVQEYVDHYAAEFGKLKSALNLSYDNFVRTTSVAHKAAAQEMWRRCAANGDIYKKKYKGLYCVGDEMFLKDTDLVNGKCLNHPTMDPISIEEENYFFKLSAYQDKILDHLKKDASVVPDFRRNELIKFVEGGLDDLSISRSKARLSHGVPVPHDDEQVMYVWFDALTNYISTLGWPQDEVGSFEKFWQNGTTYQFAGKDQLRFQSVIWQAMLMSAGLPQTDTVFYHGFINVDGQKMSKSIGNVISPYELVAKYGTDATRYILLRHVHPVDDTDITWAKLDEWYTANLVNGIGNLASRIMKMSETHLDTVEAHVAPTVVAELMPDMDAFQFQNLMDGIWKRIGDLDERIAREMPFKVIKTEPETGKRMIAELVHELAHVAALLAPSMPHTSETILAAIAENKKPENLFGRLDDARQ